MHGRDIAFSIFLAYLVLFFLGLFAFAASRCTVNWYAGAGVLCCTFLLGWWGYFHGRGPDLGWHD